MKKGIIIFTLLCICQYSSGSTSGYHLSIHLLEKSLQSDTYKHIQKSVYTKNYKIHLTAKKLITTPSNNVQHSTKYIKRS